MSLKTLLLTFFTITLLAKQSHGLCLPCPNDEITLSSFNCNCDFGLFYDITVDSCVNYASCPSVQSYSPLPNLNTLGPVLLEVFTNSIGKSKPKFSKYFELPKDFTLIVDAVKGRLEIIKKQLPALLGPIIAPIIMKNRNVLSDCKGKALCVVMEGLKKKENYKLIFPKLRPIIKEIVEEFSYVIDDIEDLSRDCSYASGCPLVRAIVDMRSFVPNTLRSFRDFSAIMFEMLKYVVGDVKSYLPYIKKDLLTQEEKN